MATAIQIEVMLDDKGVVQGIQRVTKEMDAIGTGAVAGTTKAAAGFAKMEASQRKAHESLQLISNAIGLQIPRDIEKLVSRMPGVQTALSAGFKASAVIGLVAAVGESVKHLDALKSKALDVGLAINAVFSKSLRESMSQREIDDATKPMLDRLDAIKMAGYSAGKEGIGAIKAELRASREELFLFKLQQDKALNEQFKGTPEHLAQALSASQGAYNSSKILMDQTESIKLKTFTNKARFSARSALLGAQASAARGERSIDLDLALKNREISEQERLQGLKLPDEHLAAKVHADAARADLRRAAANDIFAAEQGAAIASVSEWERANAQLVADYDARNREIRTKLHDTVIDSAEADRLRRANWNETNAKMAQQFSSDFESLFDDITSGNIGQRIKTQMRKLSFNIFGQLFSTVVGQRHGDNSALSAIGSILGIGGLGSSLPPEGSASSTVRYNGVPIANDFGAPNMAAQLFSLGGQGSGFHGLSNDPFSALLLGGGAGSSSSGGATAGTSVSGASGGIVQRLMPPGLSALFSRAGISKLLPGLLGLGGSSLGGTTGAALTTLGIGSMLASHGGALLSGLAPLAAPVAAGLFGFGIGQKYGPLAGSVAGAGSGALIGAASPVIFGATLAPLTFGLSIAIGALAGLLGGIFGRGPSKHTLADRYLQANVLPLINQEVVGYEGFGIDYATAINDLERLKADSYNQLRSQFGKDAANDEYGRYIVPAVKTAADRINRDQAERNRRSTLAFGLPQFDRGGQFRTGPGGRGLAVLDDGEVVMGRRAVNTFGARNLLALNSMANSGSAGGIGVGGGITINGPLVHAQSVDRRWLDNGGAVEILQAIRRAAMEGHA